MTVNEIKQKLDELGIEYSKDLKRDDLLKLLNEKSEEEETKQEITDQTKQINEPEPAPKRYVVVRDFKDLKDKNTIYKKGDIYPRRIDSEVDDERIAELSSTKNKQGKVLIKETD